MILMTNRLDKCVTVDGKKVNVWNCRKCGIMRSSTHTHKHGEELPEDTKDMLMSLPDTNKKPEAEKLVRQGENHGKRNILQ